MSIETKQKLEEIGAERAQLIQEVQALAGSVRSENRDFTSEETQEYDRKLARVQELTNKQETVKRLDAVEQFKVDLPTTRSVTSSFSVNPTAKDRSEGLKGWLLQGTEHQKEKYIRSADKCGMNISASELEIANVRTAQTTTGSSGADGGYTTQNELLQALVKAQIAWGGVRQVARVLSTDTGNLLPFPTMNDTANKGELVTEGGTNNAVKLTFGKVAIGAYKFSSKDVTISSELIQDSSLPIESLIGETLGQRLGMIQSDYFTTGSGSGEPQGIVTASHVGLTTTTAATSFTYGELVAFTRTVNQAYQNNAKWLVSNDFWTQCMLMVDDNGRPILNSSLEGISGGFGDTLLGKPVVVNYSMASVAGDAIPALYGDFSYFVIRDVSGIRLLRLNEKYSDNDLIGFKAYQRSSSGSIAATSSYPWQALKMKSAS